MVHRGENRFIRLRRFGARLYDWFLDADPIRARVTDVAHFLVSRIREGRLLDIGMGPGRLLADIHRQQPSIQLFGMDISPAMVHCARENLKGIRADLREGTVRRTDFETNFFDLVVCFGSFYLWNDPYESLEEVFRILKEGRSAYFFETRRDYDETSYRKALQNNLRRLDPIRRTLGPFALRIALQEGYQTEEFANIFARTSFGESHIIENVELGGLPIWVRISARKTTGGLADAARTQSKGAESAS